MLQLPLVLVIRKDEVAVFMCFYLWLLFEHTRCLRAHLHFTLFYSIHYFLLYLICFSPHWISSMTLDFLSCVHRHDLFIYNFSSQVFCVLCPFCLFFQKCLFWFRLLFFDTSQNVSYRTVWNVDLHTRWPILYFKQFLFTFRFVYIRPNA